MVSAGVFGFALVVLLGISSLPSVTQTLSWKEFAFIQSGLGKKGKGGGEVNFDFTSNQISKNSIIYNNYNYINSSQYMLVLKANWNE